MRAGVPGDERGGAAMSEYRLGKPTEVPGNTDGRGKFAPLFAQIKSLKDGLALPLEFDGIAEATKFVSGRSVGFRARGVQMRRRGATVYLSKLVKP